jgi:hypothetical protein
MFTGSPPFLLHVVAPINLLLRRKLTYRITGVAAGDADGVFEALEKFAAS